MTCSAQADTWLLPDSCPSYGCPVDQIKAPHPMGWTIANLALSAMEYKDTHVMYGEWYSALRNIAWGVDWMAKAHITASDTPTANVFVGQVRLG